jgi:hypothetical protein
MKPVPHKWSVVVTFSLNEFVLMVREEKIEATAVNIDRCTKECVTHRATLGVPTGAASSPWRVKALTRIIDPLPKRKIKRVSFLFSHPLPRTRDQLSGGMPRKYSVGQSTCNIKIHVTAWRHIPIAVREQPLNIRNNRPDVVGNAWLFIRSRDPQARNFLPITLSKSASKGKRLFAEHLCPIDYLIVDVGNILDKPNAISFSYEKSP